MSIILGGVKMNPQGALRVMFAPMAQVKLFAVLIVKYCAFAAK